LPTTIILRTKQTIFSLGRTNKVRDWYNPEILAEVYFKPADGFRNPRRSLLQTSQCFLKTSQWFLKTSPMFTQNQPLLLKNLTEVWSKKGHFRPFFNRCLVKTSQWFLKTSVKFAPKKTFFSCFSIEVLSTHSNGFS